MEGFFRCIRSNTASPAGSVESCFSLTMKGGDGIYWYSLNKLLSLPVSVRGRGRIIIPNRAEQPVNEENISAEQGKAKQTLRFQEAYEHQGGARYLEAEKKEGAAAAHCSRRTQVRVYLLYHKKGETFRGKERIGKQKDIERLFERGSRYHSKQYMLILLENDLDCLRLAVTMRRKIGGSAIRHYEKRVCREFFRKEKHGFEKGFDVLILVKERTLDFHRSYECLRGLFCRGFQSYSTEHRVHA